MQKFRGQIQISFQYLEHLGPRSVGAGVSLRLLPHDCYKFVSAADWPAESYSHAVEKGVREGLKESGFDPDMGINVLLEDINYDYIGSSEHSFYVAAKCAVMAKSVINKSR